MATLFACLFNDQGAIQTAYRNSQSGQCYRVGVLIPDMPYRHYPDLKPGFVSRPPDAVFADALQAAKDMGWQIVASDPTSLRIEATDTTPWFGFKDDVVVRLSPIPAGSRIDVRSVSRVGKSEVGTNARRIITYLSRLK